MKAELLNGRDQRVLILAPTGRDAELTSHFLAEAKLQPEICEDIMSFCHEILAGAGLGFLTGEALTEDAMQCLIGALKQQPAWSDIPLVILTSGGEDSPTNAEALAALSEAGNVTLIERPVRIMTFIEHADSCAARSSTAIRRA